MTDTRVEKTVVARSRLGNREEDPPLSPIFLLGFFPIIVPFFFQLGPLYMSASRAVLIVLVPILLIQLISGRFGRLLLTDKLIFAFISWFAVSTLKNNPAVFITFVGSNLLIQFGGYLLARAYIRGPQSFRQFIFIYGISILAFLPFSFYETVTSYMPIARILDQIPGISGSADVDYPQRRGLFRAQVTFSHPIHYGLFSTMCFSLILIGLRGSISGVLRWFWAFAIGVSCFLSVSSGPFLGILAQIALVFYGYLTRYALRPWVWLIRFTILGYILLDLASTRPAYFAIAERLAFSSQTAYVRKTLIDYGMTQIGRTPIFGIGAGRSWALPSWMTGSLDNHWLLVAMVYGVPAFVFLFGAYVYTLWKASANTKMASPEIRNMHLGWAISIVGTMLTLATVAIWSEISTLVFLNLGSGVWLLTAIAQQKEGEVPLEEIASTKRRGAGYTRFPLSEANASMLKRPSALSQLPSRVIDRAQ